MSVEQCIYLGPYVRVRPKLKKQFRDARRCSSGKCIINPRQAGAFCPACAAPMEIFQQATGYMVADLAVDIGELIDQRMYRAFTRRKQDEHWEIWLPNRTGPREFSIRGYEENEFSFEAVESFRQAEIVWINTTFPRELEIFRTHYLETEIVWGLLTWAS